METHDKETRKYFKGSKVKCKLCTRSLRDGGISVDNILNVTRFSHHQKSLVVDYKLPNRDLETRHVVSFVGGLDLCNGRYDTPVHSLFRTLDTDHKDDFYQPNFPDSSIEKGGPREPWHDIHSRLEGEIAWDVLTNFEERWKKQGGKDTLLFIRELGHFIRSPYQVMSPDDNESWNVQLFRSIDSGATFWDPPKEAAKVGLVSGEHGIIERSIQDAYIHAIRRAKNFIYIESQYFLGSSFSWESDDIKDKDVEYEDVEDEDANVLHLIPKELSLKIVSKINAKEKFTVYVVVPMWPEGIPESASVQAILYMQRRTMEMMYKDIIQALKYKGIKKYDLRDYLTFFCLGNREVKGGVEPTDAPPEVGSNYRKAQDARRFMIYVHSKMIIVDDEYIIVGSANINQRSMDGARDSEIAMGAYQPHQIETETPAERSVDGAQDSEIAMAAHQPHEIIVTPARGQVYGFRRALWYEHLRVLDDRFQYPGSTECVEEVNRLADENWNLFSSENLESDLRGHLLRYPIEVTTEGTVTGLREFFPDTKAPILGAKWNKLIPQRFIEGISLHICSGQPAGSYTS